MIDQSISPLESTVPAIVAGAELEHQELAVEAGNAIGIPTAAPEGEGEEVEKESEEREAEEVEEGEVRKPRVGRRPLTPTKAEIAEHYPLHLNYRSWCEHCRAGRARLTPHVCEPVDREKLGITVNADFAFMGPEEAEEDMQPSIVIYDDNKDAFWAMGIKTKAVTEGTVKYFKDVLDESGYEGEKLTIKTDQEPSILALKRAVAAARSGETVPIESPVRASKSNGRMENAIGVWQGQLRTIKHHAEARLKRRIAVDGVLFSWLIPYCTQIMNKYRVGHDGRTAYEKITGHKCRQQAIGFAEAVDFILEPSKKHMHKADSRVMKGIFLGYEWRTTEYLVGTAEGVFKCRTVRRRAEETSYDPDCVDFLTVTYDGYILKGARTTPLEPVVRMAAPDPAREVPVRGRDFAPRRIYTKLADYENYGFTEGCKGCVWLQNQIGPRVGHSEACRKRVVAKISEDKS